MLLFLSPASLASLFDELKNNVESKENNIEKAHLLDSALEPENSLSLTEQAEYWHNLGINLEKQHKMLEAKSAFTKSIDIYLKNSTLPDITEIALKKFLMNKNFVKPENSLEALKVVIGAIQSSNLNKIIKVKDINKHLKYEFA